MKKNYWLMLMTLVILLLGCRSESINQEEPENAEHPANFTLKVNIDEVLGRISGHDKQLSHDISNFTWKYRIENKENGKLSEDNDYYFNTDDIQKIIAENAVYYTIPAISKTAEAEDILNSLSIKISDGEIESRMIRVRLRDDGKVDIISSVPYNFNPQSVMAKEDVECTTYLVSGPCSCHEVHNPGGCTHPIQIMITQCATASGLGSNSSGSTYYTGTPTATFPSNSSGAYVYGTADQVYNTLRMKLKPDYFLTDIQKFKILESPNVASQIIAFLNQNPQHKAAAISFINSIGSISTAQGMQTAIDNYINTFSFNAGLSSAQNIWKSQHPALFDQILAYILQDYPNRKDFGYWGINFLIQNPSTTWEQFQNWFMGTPEGMDGEYVNNLDNILSTLQYQIKQMPNYSNFVNAFPKQDDPGYPGYYKQLPASQVYLQVGGMLENLYNTNGQDTGPYRNACTVRFSLAMNRLGYYIPNNELSRKGAIVDGNQWYYYLQAKTAGDFMQKTFGNPVHKLEGADANDPNKVAKFLEGKTGIYVIVNNNHKPTSQGGAGYTGHVDLIQNGHIPGGANAYNVPGGIKSIRIWEFTP